MTFLSLYEATHNVVRSVLRLLACKVVRLGTVLAVHRNAVYVALSISSDGLQTWLPVEHLCALSDLLIALLVEDEAAVLLWDDGHLCGSHKRSLLDVKAKHLVYVAKVELPSTCGLENHTLSVNEQVALYGLA